MRIVILSYIKMNNKNQLNRVESKETEREISFETEGVHIMELEGSNEFKKKNRCIGCSNGGDGVNVDVTIK